ncbi:MAG TPA: DinB family protein, partial [Mucilaginibacter sp.]|nr:DinB family protein [Mucilaginibacter sp.]
LMLLLGRNAAIGQSGNKPIYLTSAQALEVMFSRVEKNLIKTAEVMPADKYSFIPPVGEFKGVRTFGQQLKHLSATNFILGAAALGEKPPADAGDETGPDTVRTKAEIINYLKASFDYLHKAMLSIDEKNRVIKSSSVSPMLEGTASRLGLVVESLIHAYDHYGQMVEYLRMNNVIPPASM